MLSDRDSELVTALLDGELGARQRKAALRLVRRSPEARRLLKQLQEDAHGLRDLPTCKPPADLSLRVLRAIAERGLTPGGATTAPAAAGGLPAWVGLALAASVLLAVTAGSFLFFRSTLPEPEGLALDGRRAYEWPALPELPRDNPLVNRMLAGALNQYVDPGTHVALGPLKDEPARDQLTRTLRQDVAYQLSLRTTVPARQTVGRLQTALKDAGVSLLVDTAVRVKLDKGQPKASYLVYAEGLRPDEVSHVLQRFGSGAKVTDARGESVVLNPLSDDDRKQLSKLLGLKATDLRPAEKLAIHEGVVVPKDGGGKGKQQNPKAKDEPKRFAVVLALDGAAPMSVAVRDFIAARKQSRPGTLQVCFVVHEASA